MAGPKVPFCDDLHATKYRSPGETFREAMNRVASALRDDEDHYHAFRDTLLEQRFMPAGRVQAAMGSTKNVTPYNCYVSGTIEDSFVEGHGCIMDRAKEGAATMRMGGGIGYDFSTLRPNGALIKKLQSRSSGPVSFMDIFNAVCNCTASSGHRRGAQMGVLRVDHPDIEEFLHAKQNQTKLTGFNISIAVTSEFMRAVQDDGEFNLQWDGQVYKTINARTLWENIMRSTWDWAEPGILFIDNINQLNNLAYCETIAATNPCGEQPLPPFGACLLGSFNLTKYLVEDIVGKSDHEPGQPWKITKFDFDKFEQDIPHVVRAMDNIVDRAIYPLYEQQKEAKNKRRMGLGVTGVANAIEACGHAYGSTGFCEMLDLIMQTLANKAYLASSKLAQEKGSFKLYQKSKYNNSPFVGQLDDYVRHHISEHGIRNSHLLSVAPTGTISMCADNISSGIEPVFAYVQQRIYKGPNGDQIVNLEDYGKSVLGVSGKVCDDVTIDEHLAVLETASNWVDSAVSKTLNLPPTTPWEEFKDIYMRVWGFGGKGCTTYNTGGKRSGILKDAAKDDDEQSCTIDPETGRRDCD